MPARRFAIRVALIVACAGAATQAHAGSITYFLNSYPVQQETYGLSGSITTDGIVGSITAADITAWQFTIIGPGGFSQSGGAFSSFVLAKDSGTYLTTASGLFEIAQPTGGAANVLGLGLSSAFLPILWSRDSAPRESASDVYLALSNTSSSALWTAFGSPLLLGGKDPWVIAQTTPEPASIIGLAMGMAAVGAGAGWRRRTKRRFRHR